MLLASVFSPCPQFSPTTSHLHSPFFYLPVQFYRSSFFLIISVQNLGRFCFICLFHFSTPHYHVSLSKLWTITTRVRLTTGSAAKAAFSANWRSVRAVFLFPHLVLGGGCALSIYSLICNPDPSVWPTLFYPLLSVLIDTPFVRMQPFLPFLTVVFLANIVLQ